MNKKIIKKSLIGFSTLGLTMPLITLSCNESKNSKLWGDDNFNKKINLSNLTYSDELENVKFIAPFNKQVTPSNTFYQLITYAFADGNNDGIGDFIGLTENLDYFVNLGIDTLYLSPIHPASSYHGYDVIDYTDVAAELGGMEAFDKFLIKAHEKGIRVIIDLVFNHTSYEHPWFQKALQGDPKYEKYYNFYEHKSNQSETKYGIDDSSLRNLFFNVDKSIQPTNKHYVAEFWGGMPDLNLDNPEVIQELINIQSFWAKKGVDGFRYDAFYHFFNSENQHESRDDGSKIASIFAQLRKNSELVISETAEQRSNKELIMFGEWWGNPADAKVYFMDKQNNKALNGVLDGINYASNSSTFISSNTEKLVKEYLPYNSLWLPSIDNHDRVRWIQKINREFYSGKQIDENGFVNDILKNYYSVNLLNMLTKGGNPIIYHGDELMMNGHKGSGDQYVREAFNWKNNKYQVDFYERRSGINSSHIYTHSIKNLSSPEEIIKDKDSIYSILSDINKLRKEFIQLRETNVEYIVNPNEVLEHINDDQTNSFAEYYTVRKLSDNEYLLVLVENVFNKFKPIIQIKQDFSIEDIHPEMKRNITINNNQLLLDTGVNFGVFKLVRK